MSIRVTLPTPKEAKPSKGTAGLNTQVGGAPTTVSGIMEASKATGNAKLIKKSIG